MITPNAFHLIIKYLDQIDQRVSNKFFSKRPWDETALTFTLCDLLDDDLQEEEKIGYTLAHLNTDLSKDAGLFKMKLSLDTNQFSSQYERYVSQSDIGLRIKYNNQIESSLSWTKSYLLQAKRVMPGKTGKSNYTENSSFSSKDKAQELRIAKLKDKIGDHLKYLLYCPRPVRLEPSVAGKLAYLRLKLLSSHIFDYIRGQEIYSDMRQPIPTTAAGIFVSDDLDKVRNLGDVHANLFALTQPFSWFIAQQYLEEPFPVFSPTTNPINPDHQILAERIINGDKNIINELKELFADGRTLDQIPGDFTIFPSQTITLSYTVGNDLN
jgi:hypothetical protein